MSSPNEKTVSGCTLECVRRQEGRAQCDMFRAMGPVGSWNVSVLKRVGEEAWERSASKWL